MIKPTNITPLNTSDTLVYKCDKCGREGKISCSLINTDNEGNSLESLEDIKCPKCGEVL